MSSKSFSDSLLKQIITTFQKPTTRVKRQNSTHLNGDRIHCRCLRQTVEIIVASIIYLPVLIWHKIAIFSMDVWLNLLSAGIGLSSSWKRLVFHGRGAKMGEFPVPIASNNGRKEPFFPRAPTDQAKGHPSGGLEVPASSPNSFHMFVDKAIVSSRPHRHHRHDRAPGDCVEQLLHASHRDGAVPCTDQKNIRSLDKASAASR